MPVSMLVRNRIESAPEKLKEEEGGGGATGCKQARLDGGFGVMSVTVSQDS